MDWLAHHWLTVITVAVAGLACVTWAMFQSVRGLERKEQLAQARQELAAAEQAMREDIGRDRA